MLKQRTITLQRDEILIVRSATNPADLAQVRVLTDDQSEYHVFITERPFADLHINRSKEQVSAILRTLDRDHPAELPPCDYDRNR